MSAEKQKKCAHPTCTCMAASDSSYCSVECEAVEHRPDIDCRCPHPSCGGHAH